MAFSEEIKNIVNNYCNNHLPQDSWYENEFSFITDDALRKRIIAEFKSIRFAYKLYEGIEASDINLMFEVRNQILAYASIYEAVIEFVLDTYYSNTVEFDELTHHTIPLQISIPQEKQTALQNALSHDGKKIVPFYYERKKMEKAKIRFDNKCRTEVDLPGELIELYSYRNGIHIMAEQRKGISYELELSKKAYRRMKPFIDQIKDKLHQDGKI